jgi:hypothetical protein
MNWRDVLPIHPGAELFPRMSQDELRALGEDIKERGLHIPITVWKAQSICRPNCSTAAIDSTRFIDSARVEIIQPARSDNLLLTITAPNGTVHLQRQKRADRQRRVQGRR